VGGGLVGKRIVGRSLPPPGASQISENQIERNKDNKEKTVICKKIGEGDSLRQAKSYSSKITGKA